MKSFIHMSIMLRWIKSIITSCLNNVDHYTMFQKQTLTEVCEILIASEKNLGVTNMRRIDFLYCRAKYGGGRALCAGCRRKSRPMMYFVCFWLVMIWTTEFVKTETILSSVIFKTVVLLHRERLCIYIHIFLWMPWFSLRDKFIPKITNFDDRRSSKPTFLKPQR